MDGDHVGEVDGVGETEASAVIEDEADGVGDPVREGDAVPEGVIDGVALWEVVLEGDDVVLPVTVAVIDGDVVGVTDAVGGLEVEAVGDGPTNANVVNGRYEKPLSLYGGVFVPRNGNLRSLDV